MIDLMVRECSSILTLADGPVPRLSDAMQNLGIVREAVLAADSTTGLVEYIGPESGLDNDLVSPHCKQVSADNKLVMPGFVDSHTHLIFSGSRADEFYRRAQGENYLSIAQSGGGIVKTMEATRLAGKDELFNLARQRLQRLYSNGTTTVETKTGYGLSPESESLGLAAIAMLKSASPGLVFSTYLGAHLIPPEFKDKRQKYVDLVCEELATSVRPGGADFYDIFVDPLAFNREEAQQIVNAGRAAGLKLRLHADEFGDDGTAAWGQSQGALSVDHLGGIGDAGIAALAGTDTVATLLPATMFFSGHGQFAPARKLIDAGCAVALATDLNPGSSLVYSMPLTITLAVLEMGMCAEECISAATINGAFALRAHDQVGSLEHGKRADFLILDTDDYRDIAYHVGTNLVRDVYIGARKH